jgi:phage gp29-like protein
MTLYDAYGRLVDTARLRDEQAAPTMTGVRNIYSVMHPSVGLTPEKLAAVLRQAEFGDPYLYLELAEEMEEKDLHYLAVLGTRKQTIAGLQISVRPASSEAADVRNADLVRDLLLGGTLDLADTLFDILDAIGKGFSATEIIWDTSGREWMPVRLLWRDPRWFAFDCVSGEQLLVRTLGDDSQYPSASDGAGGSHFERAGTGYPGASRGHGPCGSAQRGTGGHSEQGHAGYPAAHASELNRSSQRGGGGHSERGHAGYPGTHASGPSGWAGWNGASRASVETFLQPMTAPLEPFKFIVHCSKAKSGLPIRGGLARAAGWSYLFKNYVLKDWITFAEVFGQPLRLGKYGAGATEADKQALLSAVANIGTDAAAIIPDSMIIEFTEARQSGSAELYERFCEYLDRQVSKAVLGQTLTTELPRGSGSRAAAQVHDAVRRDILASDARRLGDTLTRDLIKPIVDLNTGPQRRYPTVALVLPNDQDDEEFAGILSQLIDRGLRVSQKTVLDRLDLPATAVDEAVLHPLGTPAGDED